ncbi:FlgT C-terminal domain-containing protein [Lacticaseibacillus sharpeae]|uniref:FlgT C-terminal domain-containing protein n=1 Tax=Lacticaseibacillus sharpeae TaxID=1626 RepID=UPI0006CF4B67|nr:FlgT C-terminal domain-containing protein [Lacticaseibacillus sharpeae]
MTSKQFRVIAISDKYTLAINAGIKDKIKEGDQFDILDNDTKQLIDPETHELLATIQQKKQRIYVKEVFEKYSVCQSQYKQESISAGNLATALLSDASRVSDPRIRTRIIGRPMNVNSKDASNIFAKYNFGEIHIGDYVVKVNK